jgi:acyl-CoA synthetase (AMP-forming)/AMP-acid ligase II
MNMGDVLRRSANKFPEKDALVFGDRVISYRDLNGRVNRLANSLLKIGIQKGDRVAVLLHNCPEIIETYYTSAKIGTTFVPINNLLKQKELKEILEYVSPRVLIIDPEYAETIESLRDSLEFIEFFIGLRSVSLPHFEAYDMMIQQGNPEEPEAHVSDDDVMNMLLTSGTTGRPKGVLRTHRQNFINATTEAIEQKMDYDDRALFLAPPYHVTIESVFCRHVLMANTIVLLREGKFDSKKVLETLSRERITMLQLVPTTINALIQEENIDRHDLSHLRLLMYAASPMPAALLRRAIKKLKCQFMQLYGQTETGPYTTTLRPEDHVAEGSKTQLARLASAGRPVLDYEVRIVDEKGEDVPVDEVGEIIVKSEANSIGYWNLPEETAKTLKGGWLYTGDMGKFDEGGYVYLVDRKHDMIISGGRNIYPRELEEVLYQHKAVLEAAVIGVPDDYWVEAVKALVVLKDGMQATEEEIIDFCKKNLASYKKPRSVEFWRELPKSATGKFLKRQIREKYWKGMDRRV